MTIEFRDGIPYKDGKPLEYTKTTFEGPIAPTEEHKQQVADYLIKSVPNQVDPNNPFIAKANPDYTSTQNTQQNIQPVTPTIPASSPVNNAPVITTEKREDINQKLQDIFNKSSLKSYKPSIFDEWNSFSNSVTSSLKTSLLGFSQGLTNSFLALVPGKIGTQLRTAATPVINKYTPPKVTESMYGQFGVNRDLSQLAGSITGEVLKLGALGSVTAPIAPAVSGAVSEAVGGLKLFNPMAVRAIGGAAEQITLFATKGIYEELVRQIDQKNISVKNLAKVGLQDGLFGAMTGTAGAIGGSVARIGAQTGIGFSFPLATQYIENGKLTKDDFVNAGVNALVIAAFETYHAKQVTNAYKLKELADFQENILISKLMEGGESYSAARKNMIVMNDLPRAFKEQLVNPKTEIVMQLKENFLPDDIGFANLPQPKREAFIDNYVKGVRSGDSAINSLESAAKSVGLNLKINNTDNNQVIREQINQSINSWQKANYSDRYIAKQTFTSPVEIKDTASAFKKENKTADEVSNLYLQLNSIKDNVEYNTDSAGNIASRIGVVPLSNGNFVSDHEINLGDKGYSSPLLSSPEFKTQKAAVDYQKQQIRQALFTNIDFANLGKINKVLHDLGAGSLKVNLSPEKKDFLNNINLEIEEAIKNIPININSLSGYGHIKQQFQARILNDAFDKIDDGINQIQDRLRTVKNNNEKKYLVNQIMQLHQVKSLAVNNFSEKLDKHFASFKKFVGNIYGDEGFTPIQLTENFDINMPEDPKTIQAFFENELLSEMAGSERGERIFQEKADSNDQKVITKKSTVPYWVPKIYRNIKLIKKVHDLIVSGQLPETKEEIDLYSIVAELINESRVKQGLIDINNEMTPIGLYDEQELLFMENEYDKRIRQLAENERGNEKLSSQENASQSNPQAGGQQDQSPKQESISVERQAAIDYLKSKREMFRVEQEDPLYAEARKYKSVEEFVNGHNKFFHQTNRQNTIQRQGFDDNFTFEGASKGDPVGSGVFIKPDNNDIGLFGKYQQEVYFTKNANIKIFKNREEAYNFLRKNSNYWEKLDIERQGAVKEYLDGIDNGTRKEIGAYEFEKIYGGKMDKIGREQALVASNIYKKQGFDAIKLTNDAGGGGQILKDTYLILKPSTLKTKSQLIDIWNKANSEKFRVIKDKTVYHGTGKDFNNFIKDKRGTVTGAKSAHDAFWFTDDIKTAKSYAIYSAEEGPVKKALEEADKLEKIAKKSNKQEDWEKYDNKIIESEKLAEYDNTFFRRKQAVIKAVIKTVIINADLYEVDANGKTPQELSDSENIDSWLEKQISIAKTEKKEGVLIKNLNDAVGLSEQISNHYAIFDEKNIRVIENADVKFRTGDIIERKTGIKISDAQRAEINQLNKEIFGDSNINYVERLMTPTGQQALGSHLDQMIKIVEGQANAKDTFYHEAVHRYMDILADMGERAGVLEEFKNTNNLDTYDQAEEVVAENFINYAKSREGFVGKIKQFFDNILNKINALIGNVNKINVLYSDILSGVPAKLSEQKIIDALKKSKRLLPAQQKLYTKERQTRVARAAAMGKKVKGEQGLYAQLGQLKGELPKIEIESIRQDLKQEDIDNLFQKIEDHKYLLLFEKITAKSALSNLLMPEGGVLPTKGEIKLLSEIFSPELIKTIQDKRDIVQKLTDQAINILNIPRAIMATADLSAPLRQGIFLIGRPKQFIPAFKEMFKYAFNERAYEGLNDSIKQRPTYKLMRQGKLALTDEGADLTSREEDFMSNLPERIPLLGSIARGSNRAYSGFLNKLRADTFDSMVKNMQASGTDFKENPEVLNQVTRFINAATGRGNLPEVLKGFSTVGNALFFSPRLMFSRMQLLTDVLNPYYYLKTDPAVRNEYLKSLFSFVAFIGIVLGLCKMAGFDVETDSRNSDFGKIKVGKTRWDVMGGFQQYFVLASRLIQNEMVSSTTGKEFAFGEGYKPTTRLDVIKRFLTSKTSPITSFVVGMLEGKTSLGEDFNVPVEILDRLIPMVTSDMYDLYKEYGIVGLILATPGIFGVGSQTYADQVPTKSTTEAGNPTIKWRQAPGLSEDIINAITGKRISEIPQSEWKGLAEERLKKTMDDLELDKVKVRVRETGKEEIYNGTRVYLKDGIVKTYNTGESKTPLKDKILDKKK